MMETQKTTGSHVRRAKWRLAVGVLLLALLVTAAGISPFAQSPTGDVPAGELDPTLPPGSEGGPSDLEISSQLEAVVLEQTASPDAVNVVIEIPALQDTYVASKKPNQNYGLSSELRLGYSLQGANDGALRTFVQFDVARYVPRQAVINRATMQIFLFAASPAFDGPMGAEARHLETSWSETAVTWNSHQPAWGGVLGSGQVSSVLGWHYTEVTPLVRQWHDGTRANNGLIFIGDERIQERQRLFHSLNAANNYYPRLVVDYTTSGDITPPVASVNPLPAWSPSSFDVSWDGTDSGGSGIAYFDVQYRYSGSGWIDWLQHTTSRSARFVGAQNGQAYKFRARAVDNAGNVQAFGDNQAQTAVDTIAPYATVDPLPPETFAQSFMVSWGGSDNVGGSGLVRYDVQVRFGDGTWQLWRADTTTTSGEFTGAVNDGRYSFRARGIDVAGNVQPWSAGPQAETTVKANEPVSYVKPFNPTITQEDSFLVQWTGSTSPGASIDYFDVRYRFENGPWIQWLSQTKQISAVFTDLNPQDGAYGFEVRARDTLGRLEEWKGKPEASIAVDRLPPFMVPQAWLPIVNHEYYP